MICFFEGEDVKYFGIRIDYIFGNGNWYPIECSGKKDVLELYDVIINLPIYSTVNLSFFIDRDFDRQISKKLRSHIYETPCYSIENLYSTSTCFKKIIEAEFKLTEYCDDADSYLLCMQAYEKAISQFHNAILVVNAFIKAHRIEEKIKKIKPLNLANVKINKLVKIDLSGVQCLYDREKLKVLFPDSQPIENLEVDQILESFSNKDLTSELRGKYEAEFTLQFLLQLKKDRRSDVPSLFKQRGSVKLNLSRENFISELSQYADTPDCLMRFLRARKRKTKLQC